MNVRTTTHRRESMTLTPREVDVAENALSVAAAQYKADAAEETQHPRIREQFERQERDALRLLDRLQGGRS